MEDSVTMELGYILASTAAERSVQRWNAWESPRLPTVDHVGMRRWASAATWTPPGCQPLVRHRAVDGSRRIITNDRTPPDGYVIEYDLGMAHRFGQPGTQKVIVYEQSDRSGSSYFRTPFEGGLADGYRELGYVENAPLPMLDVLKLRYDMANDEEVLVAGVDDPLYGTAIPVATLGFVESYPIQPRHPPDRKVDWSFVVLLRSVDSAHWRHRYRVEAKPDSAAVTLGGLWTRSGSGFVALYRNADGTVTSELCPRVPKRVAVHAQLRWAGAPLSWTEGRPRAWAVRAMAGRLKALAAIRQRDTRYHLASSVESVTAGRTLLGYLRRLPSPGWSPLFSAIHPAVADQYVTRSEVEATDMGYVIEGVLGYVFDRFADRSPEAFPAEVKWASHFGQRRRYIEGPRPW